MESNAPLPAHPTPVKRRSGGCGCCAGGCLSMVVISFLLLVGLVALTWFFAGRTLNGFTSNSPTAIQMSSPTEAQVEEASAKLETIRTASAGQPSVSVEFTADELNALIARHPSFADLRGKFRVGIANSILHVEMSVPLKDVPMMSHRWFNGSARFGLVYDENRFNLAVKSLEANGHNIGLSRFQVLADWFNDAFNEGFEKSQRDTREEKEFWGNVKAISVVGDKVIITTKGTEPSSVGA